MIVAASQRTMHKLARKGNDWDYLLLAEFRCIGFLSLKRALPIGLSFRIDEEFAQEVVRAIRDGFISLYSA
jgi:hypothetical protein